MVLKDQSYLIRKADRRILHELDESGRGAAVGRGAATRQHEKIKDVNRSKAPNTGMMWTHRDSNLDICYESPPILVGCAGLKFRLHTPLSKGR
jgi:hypothetical protein